MATRKKVEAVAEVVKEPTIPLTPREIADKMRAKFIVAATDVANDMVADQVAESIISDLNAQKREVTLKLLGLDNRWGKWDVDHCNGRSSPITAYLAESAQEVIKAWVNEAVVEVLTEERKKKIQNAAKRAMQVQVEVMIETHTKGYHLRERAEHVVKALMDKAANEVRVELGLIQGAKE